MVFVNSMSDLFHEDVPDDYIEQVLAVCFLNDRHTFQILSDRGASASTAPAPASAWLCRACAAAPHAASRSTSSTTRCGPSCRR
jgi:protein gp37